MRRLFLSVLGIGLLATNLFAAESAKPMKTYLTERGKLLLSLDLDQPLGKDWRSAKGKWEIVDGALHGAEISAEKHGAVTRHALPHTNVIIQYSFKLDGARNTSLSINDKKGHCCRLRIDPKGITVQKDSHDHNVADKTLVLGKRPRALAAGKWHTVVFEILGNTILANLDGTDVVVGMHSSFDVPKSNFGLAVAGDSVSFKDLRVWEALPNKNWEKTKAKLMIVPTTK